MGPTDDFAQLDSEAIAAVREEAWPEARDADELHDALMSLGFLTDAEVRCNPAWRGLFEQLIAQRRATTLTVSPIASDEGEGWVRGPLDLSSRAQGEIRPVTQRAPALPEEGASVLVAAERFPKFAGICPGAPFEPSLTAPEEFPRIEWTAETALVAVLRARMTGLGPITTAMLAHDLQLPQSDI